VALGIGQGDEVITTPMTFAATLNSIIRCGARPILVDVEADTGNLDAGLVEAAVSIRTKAVIPVHLYGQPCDMRSLAGIADRRGLALVEDAAHCVEGVRDGIRPGILGTAACFSFYATKNLTAGEGGAVASRDAGLLSRVRRLRLHGIDRDAASRHGGQYVHWDQVELGFKANMCDIQAALLRPQLARIESLRLRRERIARRYDRAFAGIPGIGTPALRPETIHARHLYTIQVDPVRRDAWLWALQQKGIGVAVNFRPVHMLTWHRDLGRYPGAFPNAERIGASTITLPMYPRLTRAEQDRVIEAVLELAQGDQ
jgi:UDP-4-amino-4-deoxy-L-arabinose-oxoglutarate aminotransferase